MSGQLAGAQETGRSHSTGPTTATHGSTVAMAFLWLIPTLALVLALLRT